MNETADARGGNRRLRTMVGLDVHKDTVVAAVAKWHDEEG